MAHAGVILIAGGVTIAALIGAQYGGASGTNFTQVAPHAVKGLNSAATLFTVNPAFNATGFPLWYAFLLGLLLAQYTYTGYDASAHMTEETIGAETRAPWGVVMSVVVSAFAGYILLMSLVATVPELSKAATAINPVIFIMETRLGFVLGTLLF